MLERLEDLYLNIFRYLLIISASIALILGVINLFISLSKILDNPDEEEINFPVWSELKYDILPISQPKTPQENTTPGTFEPEKKEIEVPPDHRIVKVLKNLDRLFEGEKVNFSSKNTANSILTWITTSGITEKDQIDVFLDGLVTLSKDMSTEKRILQIGDLNSRIDTIYDSLEIYKDHFKVEMKRVDRINSVNANSSQEKNIQGYSDLQITLYAALVFVLVLLIVLIFKVEFNLRKIAPSILNKK